jgi:hypothetical protein
MLIIIKTSNPTWQVELEVFFVQILRLANSEYLLSCMPTEPSSRSRGCIHADEHEC